MKTTSLLLVGALVAPFFIAPADAAPMPYRWDPPARFDHPYTPMRIVVQPLWWILMKCFGTCYAYTPFVRPGALCTMYIPAVDNRHINAEGQAALIRHERGHCNGWPANHPK